MRVTLQLLAAALPLVAAWPTVMEASQKDIDLEKRATVYPKVPPPKFHSGRDNCGSHGKCTVFDAKDQFVDVRPGSGHVFKSPGPKDLRGQCPGLNAAANHNYMPRNGIATTQQTIDGLNAAYSMSTDLGAILAVIAIAISGDPIAGTWSIGDGYKGTLGLLGRPTGIGGTHNRYEGDASIVRGDAYMHGGFVGAFEMHRWEHLYSLLGKQGLTHDKAAAQAYYTAEFSKLNNPYYFSGPFSGLVAPDAHNFVVNLMSNRSAEHPGGYLDTNTLMSFFAVTGTPGAFVHHDGMERIPDNWYRRPSAHQMTTASTNIDTVVNNQVYPGVIKFGGNTGKVNTFTGVDVSDLTGGVLNGESLFQGNNLACFMLQATQQSLTDSAYPLVESASKLLRFFTKNLGPVTKSLSCPQLKNFNNTLFASFPGAKYKGQGE